MQYALINEVLESPFEYKKIVNLTGTDFPVASNDQLISTLSSETNEFIIGYRLATDKTDCKDKVLYYYEYDKGKNVRLFWAAIRKILKIKRFKDYDSIGYDFYFGSEYWALSYNVVLELMNIWKKDATLRKILKNASIPSEIWIHTLFFNSKYAFKGEVFEKQYEGLSKLAPLTYFVYKDAIKVLTAEDYNDILKSGKLFVRKVITGKSDDLIRSLSLHRKVSDEERKYGGENMEGQVPGTRL